MKDCCLQKQSSGRGRQKGKTAPGLWEDAREPRVLEPFSGATCFSLRRHSQIPQTDPAPKYLCHNSLWVPCIWGQGRLRNPARRGTGLWLCSFCLLHAAPLCNRSTQIFPDEPQNSKAGSCPNFSIIITQTGKSAPTDTKANSYYRIKRLLEMSFFLTDSDS